MKDLLNIAVSCSSKPSCEKRLKILLECSPRPWQMFPRRECLICILLLSSVLTVLKENGVLQESGESQEAGRRWIYFCVWISCSIWPWDYNKSEITSCVILNSSFTFTVGHSRNVSLILTKALLLYNLLITQYVAYILHIDWEFPICCIICYSWSLKRCTGEVGCGLLCVRSC